MKNNKNFTEEERCFKNRFKTFKENFSIKRLFKNQKKRILAFVLALLTFGSTMTNVIPAFALTSGDSTTISQEWYSDVEYSISGWTDANGDRHYSRSGQLALYKEKSTGKPVYCIEPDVSADVSKTASTTGNFEILQLGKKFRVNRSN